MCTRPNDAPQWLASGRPHYVSQDGTIAYISDVGADILKPLFVTGCCFTGIGFVLSLAAERWLRHSGRLAPTMRKRERVRRCVWCHTSALLMEFRCSPSSLFWGARSEVRG